MTTAEAILAVLDLAIAGAVTLEELQALRQQVADMQAEGRDPTAEEWAALFARIDRSTASIIAADEGDPT